MGKRILLWIPLILFTVAVMAQEVPAEVVMAFKKGSSTELSVYLGDKVDMIIQNDSKNVSKTVAEKMMEAFFTQNKVNGFTVNHKGKRNDSGFFVGTLETNNGNYRINCFFKRIQNQYLIHQIRIDKANE